MKRRMRTTVFAAIGLAALLGMTGCGAASGGGTAAAASGTVSAGSAQAAEAANTITVSETGTVYVVPDKAEVFFGVTSQEATAEAAQNKNSEDVAHVIDVLTGRGVEEKSIRTTYYGMYPQYDWSEDGEQKILGYSVTTSMAVSDQDIDALGELLSACVAAGINNVDSVSFLCSGYDEAYREALGKAVEASRVKAEAIAAAAGKTLGEPVAVNEGWQDTSARYQKNVVSSAAYDMEEAAMDGGPSFQPGETEIVANVTVSYEMK